MDLFKLVGTVAIDNKKAVDGIGDTVDEAKKASDSITKHFKKIGTAVATFFAVDRIINFGQQCVDAAATVAAEVSAFEQIMGDYSEEAAEKVSLIAEATGMVDSRLTTYMTSMTAKFKGLGYGVEEATDYASRGLTLAADAAAFWDKSLDESMSHLNSFINGSYEGGEAIGLFANDTQMAMYAVERGIVSTTSEWANLDEATKQATRMEYAENMFELSGATGQAAKEADQYANVKANLNEKWRQFLALVGEPVLQNIVVPGMKLAINFIDKLSTGFENASNWVKDNKDKLVEWSGYIVGATTAVGTFLLILNWGKVMSAAAAALTLVKTSVLKLNQAIAKNPIGLVASLIAGLISWLIYLYNTNEDFRNFVNGMLKDLWDKMQPIIAWIKSNVIPVVKELFDWIKSNAMPIIQSVIAWIKSNVIPVVKPIVDWLVTAIGDFFSWFGSIFQSTSDSAGGIWQSIVGFFQSAWEFIVGIWEACQPFFQGVWDGIILPVWGLVQEMWGAFQMAWDVIKLVWGYVEPYFAALWENIKTIFSVVWIVLSTYFKNAWEAIKLVWGVAVEFFELIWNSIKAVFSVVVTILGGFFRTAWEVIKATWNTVIAFFTMVWAGIKAVFAVVKGVLSGDFSDAWEAIKNLWDKAKAYFNTVWEGIKNVFGSVGKWFGDTFKAAYDAIKTIFSSIGSFFSGIWEKIKNTFSKLGTNIGNAISGAVKAGINGVIGSIEGVINGGIGLINGAINLINKIPGVEISKIKKVQFDRLAEGGVVDEATPAIFGEDGAEAVVPLEKNTGWLKKVARQLHDFSLETKNDLSGALSTRYVELQQQQVSETQMLNEKVDRIINLLMMFFPEMIQALDIDMYLNDDVLVATTAHKFDTAFGNIAIQKGRGR